MMLAWLFLRDDESPLGQQSRLLPPRYASPYAIEAFDHGHGPVVYRVQLPDGAARDTDAAEDTGGAVLWRLDRGVGERVAQEFARWAALQVADLWKAPGVVREWLETGDEDKRDAAAEASFGALRARMTEDALRVAWGGAQAAGFAAVSNGAPFRSDRFSAEPFHAARRAVRMARGAAEDSAGAFDPYDRLAWGLRRDAGMRACYEQDNELQRLLMQAHGRTA